MTINFLQYYPLQDEVLQLKQIWKKVFADKDGVISYFFDNIYKPQQTLVVRKDEKIVSVLYLLDCEISILNKKYPSFYIYAAATLPEYRKQGHMAELLAVSKVKAEQEGRDFISLFPENESLYDFYEKFDYEPIFKTKKIKIKGTSIRVLKGNDLEILPPNVKDLLHIRNQALRSTDAQFWNEEVLAYQAFLLKAYEGQAFAAYKNKEPVAYVLAERGVNGIEIKEALSVNMKIDSIAAILDKEFNFVIYSLAFPTNFGLSSDNMEVFSSGMALAITDEAKFIKERIKSLYMGLNLG